MLARTGYLLLTLTLVALSACGTDRRTAAPQGDGASMGLTGTLQVQAAGGQGELDALRELLAAYEAARPGVSTSFVGVPNQGDHIAKLSTAFAAGSPPDVFLLNYRRLGPFVDRDVLAPAELGEVEPADLYAPPLEAFTYDGELACVPQNVSSSVVYLNLDLFAEAGVALPEPDWTWEQLQTAAVAFGAKDVAAIGFAPGIRTVAPFVWTAGGEIVDDTEAPSAITLDTSAGRKALGYLDGLQQFGVNATSRAAADPDEQFAAGELAMFIDSRRSVPAFRKAEGLSFDVRPLPRARADRPSASLLASDAYCVSKATEVPSLAADFTAFAVGREGGTVLARSGRTVPALIELAESEMFLDSAKQPASSQVWLDIIPDLRRLPNVGPQDEAEEAADDLLEQFFAGKSDLESTATAVRRATEPIYGRS